MSESIFDVATQFFKTRRRINEIERKALRKASKDLEPGAQCSFCGKYASEVDNLVQGIETVNICNECTTILSQMLASDDEH